MAVGSPAAETRTWTGSAGDADWFNPANWQDGAAQPGLPDTGDTVVVPAGSVVLSNATPALAAFTISGATLTFTNWMSALQAAAVTIDAGGVLTLPPAFTEAQMSNRVWVVCSNFSLAAAGTILADGRGYADEHGLGAGTSSTGGSGSGYGGKGGMGVSGLAIGQVYGSAQAPIDPGSGAPPYGGAAQYRGHHGGGAVRIEATGTVIINGTVSANAARLTSPNPVNYASGASGGSIYITCHAFGGSTNGLLRADGGSGGSVGGGGGGGRIAVDYQALDGVPGVRFSVFRGRSGWRTIDVNAPVEAFAPRMGTLWFPDPTLLESALAAWGTAGLHGYNGAVHFASTNRWPVSGDLVLVDSTLELATNTVWRIAGNGVFSGQAGLVIREYGALDCGGDLLLTNGASLIVYGGHTNAGQALGATVDVGGWLAVAANSWIYPFSEATNGGSVRFRAGHLSIAAGGGINAVGRGYAYASGPGRGISNAGGGYGGKGGNSQGGVAGGAPYGCIHAPRDPGSGGSRYGAQYLTVNHGGGTVWLEIAGTARVDGTINADGAPGNNPSNFGAGGSGGAIFILCRSFKGAATGILRADGGTGGTAAGAGGGGRIAVGIGFSDTARQLLLADAVVPGLMSYAQHPDYLGAISAATNGTGYWKSPPNGAEPGSALFMKTLEPYQRSLTILGDPAQYGAPAPQTYGNWTLSEGSIVSNTVVSPTDETDGLRRAGIGWRLTDTDLGTLIDQGASTAAVFTVTTNLTLTWLWTNEYFLAIAADPYGRVNADAITGWYTNGVTVPGLTAIPLPDHYFVAWRGADVPPYRQTDNPLAVIQDRPRTNITAVFASIAPQTRTWTGTGEWLHHANWAPDGVPGSNDVVVIASGQALLDAATACDRLWVSNGATLVFTNWATRLSVRGSATVASNAVITLAPAFTTLQMSNRIWISCADFRLEAGGSIQADARGYANDYGPGRGINGVGCSGAGYGGKGGNGSGGALGGSPYGCPYMPLDPGSGAPVYGGNLSYVGAHGGGAIRIDAAADLVIDGRVTANGGRIGGPNPVNYGAGGSGGSILFNCGRFFGGSNAVIRADGGLGGTQGGGGGGGRIAVWIRVADASRQAYLNGHGGGVMRLPEGEFPMFHGTVSANNGTGWRNPDDPAAAYPGTRFLFVHRGSLLQIR